MTTKEIKPNEDGCSVSLRHESGDLVVAVLSHIADNFAVYVPYNCEKCPLGSDKEPVMIEPQLRKMYDRKQSIHYPVFVENNRMEFVDEGKNNAYIIVNKRDLRLSKTCYRFISAAEINDLAYATAKSIVEETNKIMAYGRFSCDVAVKEDDGEKGQHISGIVAGSPKELAERIIDRLEYLETSLDRLIEQAANDIWKMLNF